MTSMFGPDPAAMDRADALMARLQTARSRSEEYPLWALAQAFMHRHPDEAAAVLAEVEAKLGGEQR